MQFIDAVLNHTSAPLVYSVTSLVVALESLGIPLPGETTVVTAALLATMPNAHESFLGVFIAAWIGAAVGDSLGYGVGHKWGDNFFGFMTRHFPRLFSEHKLAALQRLMVNHGPVTVFAGRFVSILRTFAGPLAGSMGMTYRRFLLANVLGGAAWAGAVTATVAAIGAAAHKYLALAGWLGLAVVIIVLAVGYLVSKRIFAEEPEAVAR